MVTFQMDLLMGMFFSGMCCRGNKMWGFKIKNKSEDMVMQNHAAGVTDRYGEDVREYERKVEWEIDRL